MKIVHPNARCSVFFALAICLLSAVGCRTQQGGLANPFLAPNRVPPPSTRAILPGQAQPYYPGDPLPVMQSAAPQVVAPLAGNSPPPAPIVDSALNWNAPPSVAASVAAAAPAPRASTTPGVEPAVSIPADVANLRFQQSTTEPPSVAPQPTSVAQTNLITPTLPPPAQPVAQASYTEPDMNRPVNGMGFPPPAGAAPASSTLWRSPGINQPTMATMFVPQTSAASPLPPGQTAIYGAPQGQTLFSALTNSMDVQMRQVTSPPPAPGDPMPRIRMPGYIANTQPSADGFRPRTSMK